MKRCACIHTTWSDTSVTEMFITYYNTKLTCTVTQLAVFLHFHFHFRPVVQCYCTGAEGRWGKGDQSICILKNTAGAALIAACFHYFIKKWRSQLSAKDKLAMSSYLLPCKYRFVHAIYILLRQPKSSFFSWEACTLGEWEVKSLASIEHGGMWETGFHAIQH